MNLKVVSSTLVLLLVLFSFSVVAYAQTASEDISLSTFVELLIAIGVILPEKVELARSVANEGSSNKNVPLNLSRVLQRGMEGEDVQSLQIFLTETGDYTYPEITGYFGSVTEEAVQRYQRRNGIVSSGTPVSTGYGVVGPKTRDAINNTATASLSVKEASIQGQSENTLASQDKSLAPTQGQYAQSYYQGAYQSAYYGQAYYQSYYQSGYIAQSSYVTASSNPTSEVVTETDGTLVLPVYVHLIQSDVSSIDSTFASSNIQNMFTSNTGVNEYYWSSAKIRWDIKDISIHTITNGSDHTYNAAIQEGDTAAARNAIPYFAEGVTLPNGFNVFVVGGLPGIIERGIYYAPGRTGAGISLNDGVAFVSETGGLQYATYIAAHELGHALGLGHVSGSTNLMTPAGSSSLGPLERNELTANQILTARAQAETGQRGTPPN